MAEQQGKFDEVQRLRAELEELEERAAFLDKQRNKGLSAIR